MLNDCCGDIGAVVQEHLANIPFTKSAQTLTLHLLQIPIGRLDIVLLDLIVFTNQIFNIFDRIGDEKTLDK